MLDDAALPPEPSRRAAVERAWSNLTGPGPLLSAAERHDVIRDARAGWAGSAEPDPARGVQGQAAHWLAVDAEGLTADIVADLEARGLDRLRYLEIVGIVARLANIDFYVRALGAAQLELGDPASAPPTNVIHPDAAMSNMWVPTVGQTFAPHVVDALPDEGRAVRDLHGPMYVPLDRVGDPEYGDVLTKPQIEYLAARTSYLNECFY